MTAPLRAPLSRKLFGDVGERSAEAVACRREIAALVRAMRYADPDGQPLAEVEVMPLRVPLTGAHSAGPEAAHTIEAGPRLRKRRAVTTLRESAQDRIH